MDGQGFLWKPSFGSVIFATSFAFECGRVVWKGVTKGEVWSSACSERSWITSSKSKILRWPYHRCLKTCLLEVFSLQRSIRKESYITCKKRAEKLIFYSELFLLYFKPSFCGENMKVLLWKWTRTVFMESKLGEATDTNVTEVTRAHERVLIF